MIRDAFSLVLHTEQHNFHGRLEPLITKAGQLMAMGEELLATNLELRMDTRRLIRKLRATIAQGRAIRLNRQHSGNCS